MKKTKFIALALVLCLALMGSAFAYWNQSVSINSIVKTGNLDITIEPNGGQPGMWFFKDNEDGGAYAFCSSNLSDYASQLGIEDYVDLSVEDFGMDAQCVKAGKNAINMSLTNAFPGSGARYDFYIKNTGTVPAKIKEVKVDVDNNNTNLSKKFYNNIEFRMHYYIVDENGNMVGNYHGVDGVVKFINLKSTMYNALKDIILGPNQKIYFGAVEENGIDANALEIFIPHSWNNNTETKNFKFNINFNFTQANDFSN